MNQMPSPSIIHLLRTRCGNTVPPIAPNGLCGTCAPSEDAFLSLQLIHVRYGKGNTTAGHLDHSAPGFETAAAVPISTCNCFPASSQYASSISRCDLKYRPGIDERNAPNKMHNLRTPQCTGSSDLRLEPPGWHRIEGQNHQDETSPRSSVRDTDTSSACLGDDHQNDDNLKTSQGLPTKPVKPPYCRSNWSGCASKQELHDLIVKEVLRNATPRILEILQAELESVESEDGAKDEDLDGDLDDLDCLSIKTPD
ncbi:hypothetical protein B0T19DRAFT_295450 [Cercophora scortea]|uniref:Uncharacterized protein n=1 Tax=Cercophora scortea TaxID=314031 RepID=A0AAE0I307_9PEZI|nr:hypothetical protein B0T19DRAFT_295450 [Cercophora scortea]